MNRWRILKRLLGMIKRLWGIMAVSTLMRALNYGSGIAILALGARGIGLAFFSPERVELLPFALILIGIGALKGVFRYLEHFTGHYVAFHLLSILRNHSVRGIGSACAGGFDEHPQWRCHIARGRRCRQDRSVLCTHDCPGDQCFACSCCCPAGYRKGI